MPGPPLVISAHAFAALQIGPLAAIALLYAWRARTLARTGAPVPRWRQACFYGGSGLIAAALLALGATAKELLWVNMGEHLLIGDLAPLLLVLGLTRSLLDPILRVRPLGRLVRTLAHPAIALPLWALSLYAWRLPALSQAALRHYSVGGPEHAIAIALGVNMWMCLLGPLPAPRWFGDTARFAYVLAVRAAGAVLANMLLWAGSIIYPYYLTGDARHRISPIADQNIAGAILLGECAIVTLGLLCWLFLRAGREVEERTDLLDYARAPGLELSEARVARAVSSGEAAEPRRRLEVRADAHERLQQARSSAVERA